MRVRVPAAGADGRLPRGGRRGGAHAAALGLRDPLRLPRARRGQYPPRPAHPRCCPPDTHRCRLFQVLQLSGVDENMANEIEQILVNGKVFIMFIDLSLVCSVIAQYVTVALL